MACLLLANGFGACSSKVLLIQEQERFLQGQLGFALHWSIVPVPCTMSAALSPDDVTLGAFVEISSFVVNSCGQVNNVGCY